MNLNLLVEMLFDLYLNFHILKIILTINLLPCLLISCEQLPQAYSWLICIRWSHQFHLHQLLVEFHLCGRTDDCILVS